MEEKKSEQVETTEPRKYKSYLLLHNVSKKKNVGTIIRSACAFDVDTIFLVSKNIEHKKYRPDKDFNFFGNQNTVAFAKFYGFGSLKEAKDYFVANKITVCGIEIMKEAKSVVTHPFKGDTVFILGNEGTGMNENQKAICDQFVYIPQYTNKTASLNVAVSAAILFHHFADSVWANFKESPIFSEKFQDREGEGEDDEDEEGEGKGKKKIPFTFHFTAHKNPEDANKVEAEKKENDNMDLNLFG